MPADPTTLPALIAALREAVVGSRELDARIALAMGCDPHIADWTTSLDAALTLVPDIMCWEVSSEAPRNVSATFRAYAGQYGGRQRTPALALCIAALRARGAG